MYSRKSRSRLVWFRKTRHMIGITGFALEVQTERCGRVVITPASYSGGPGFKSQAGDRPP
jgi:hypothetical protein